MVKPERSTPRFPFIAPAEIFSDLGPGAGATVKEISLYGCYLDFMNTYPARTHVTVKIFWDSTFFEAKGTVIYAKPDVGIGVAFRDVKPEFLRVLQKWLLKAMQQQHPPLSVTST
jgi:hypothetical protein